MPSQECAQNHSIVIFDRGGQTRVTQLVDLAEVSYDRVRSDKTPATVVVSGRSCRVQTSAINKIASRRHEMAIFRGNERVWEGPIISVKTRADRATIVAHDINEYIESTSLSKEWPPLTGVPVSGQSALMLERVRTILTHELTESYTMRIGTGGAAQNVVVPRWEELDPPANILPYLDIRESTTLLTRSSTLEQQMSAFEHLGNLAEGGLDFTALGRSLIVWDSAQALGRTRTLTEADFYGDPEVIESGSDHWSIQHIRAQANESAEEDGPVEEIPSVGSAGGAHPFYGVWTNIKSMTNEEGTDEPTQDELNSQAQRGLVGRTPVPVEIRFPAGTGIRLTNDLTLNDLVPGVIVPVVLQTNLRKLSQEQLLTAVSVRDSAAGETVSVTLVPAGDVFVVGE